MRTRPFYVLLILALAGGCAPSRPALIAPPMAGTASERARAATEALVQECLDGTCGLLLHPSTQVQSTHLHSGHFVVELNDAFAQTPVREHMVRTLETDLLARLASERDIQSVEFRSRGMPISELIPNLYRVVTEPDQDRNAERPEPRPIVVRAGHRVPGRGLHGRHIALWASHGWYYERTLDRWEWQRARLFTTVEDVFPTAFVTRYLAPMLEQAGAQVWMPRERDTRSELLIADADGSTPGATVHATPGWENAENPGFALGSWPYGDGDEPFQQGRYARTRSSPDGGESIRWTFEVPETGEYSVQIAYGSEENASPEAEYLIRYYGGEALLKVDQRMAAGTWVWLGQYRFRAGSSAVVELTNRGPAGHWVAADAVRLGGGMGISERGGSVSGRPRWTEAARYHMQFSGMPRASVYSLSDGANDYTDDYRGRGEWVNFLRGAPYGPNTNRMEPGLGVPVDLSLAFHTDAGVARADTTIGTLVIYSGEGADTSLVFPDGRSRLANRDLADILQSQLTRDVRATFDELWSRRPIWDRDYSEAVRPNVPSVLLELLSHQNFADMKLGLDPRFRFLVSRAIYKAIVRYLAASYGEPDPVIQPLAPDHLQVGWTPGGDVRVAWRPVHDELEPSARPDRYRVQRRLGDAGFDAGQVVTGTALSLAMPDYDGVVSYRVIAENDGGASAPSEVVSIGGRPDDPRVLIVAGFDRVSPPAAMDSGPWRGFVDLLDQGVPDGYDLAFVGVQHEFDAAVPWKDDDDPGHGASFGTWEGRRLPGNTFDFAAVHGEAILSAGFAFETVSDEAFSSAPPDEEPYVAVDLVLGEERATTPGHATRPEYAGFSDDLMQSLRAWAQAGKPLFVSGSYVGSELVSLGPVGVQFADEVLGIQHRTDRAVRRGLVVDDDGNTLFFHADRNEAVYAAESPDAIDPSGDGAETVLRYGESNMSAAVAFDGPHRAVTWGFPFETLKTPAERNRAMAEVLNYLTLTK